MPKKHSQTSRVHSENRSWTALGLLRNELKSRIKYRRSRLTPSGFSPVCAVCGKSAPDFYMNEAIITRGDAQRLPKEHRLRIHHECNVSVYCPGCAGQEATKNGNRKSILSIVEAEGLDNIVDWLDTMREFFTDDFIDQQVRLVRSVAELLTDEHNVVQLQQQKGDIWQQI